MVASPAWSHWDWPYRGVGGDDADRAQLYEFARARLTESDEDAAAALVLPDRHLPERYLGLAGRPATSVRQLASQTGMTRHALERRITACLGSLPSEAELGRPCAVCGRGFVPPYLSSTRKSCSAGRLRRRSGIDKRERAASARVTSMSPTSQRSTKRFSDAEQAAVRKRR